MTTIEILERADDGQDEMFWDDEPEDDIDDEADEAECGRWIDGRLGFQCRLAGTEWCDWDCPIGLSARRPISTERAKEGAQ